MRYYLNLSFGGDNGGRFPLALVSVFSDPDYQVLQDSFGTCYICQYQGDTALKMVDVKSIQALVAMIPDYHVTEDGAIITPEDTYFLMEKLTLPITQRFRLEEDEEDDEQ